MKLQKILETTKKPKVGFSQYIWDIEEKLRQFDGVIAPRFNKEHLLVVYYNSKKTTSLLINNFIHSIGYKTHLVGM